MTALRRLLRAAASAVALAALLVGLPAFIALIASGTAWPQSWAQLHQELFTASTDNPLLGPVLLLIGAIAWLHLAYATLVEFAYQVRRVQPPELTLPSLRVSQSLVHGLVAAVLAAVMIAAVAGPAIAAGSSAPSFPVPTFPGPAASQSRMVAALPAVRATAAVPTSAGLPGSATGTRVHVQAGDSLWSLAEDHLGQGEDWTRIWQANRDTLTDPSTIPVGATLTIPPARTAFRAPVGWTIVQSGETLRELAHRELGDESRWPEIYHLNSHRIADPDLLRPGWQLRLPQATGPHVTASPVAPPVVALPPAPAEQRGRPLATPPQTAAPTQPTPVPASATLPTAQAPDTAATASAPVVPGPTATAQASQPAPTLPAAATPATDAVGAVDGSGPRGLGALTLGGLGCFAAAGVLALLGVRRRRQMRRRRPGQRIPLPNPEDRDAELEALAVEQPTTVAFLDTVLRGIAAHAVARRRPVPALLGVRLDTAGATLVLSEPQTFRPDWVTVDAVGNWRVDRSGAPPDPAPDAADLEVASPDGADPADPVAPSGPDEPVRAAPYPALLTLGPTADGASLLLLNLEAARALTLIVDPADDRAAATAEGVLAAMAVEFGTSRLADHLVVHAVGWGSDLAPLTLQDRFHHHASLADALPMLEASADGDTAALADANTNGLPDARVRHGATDLLAPQIVLCVTPPTPEELDRLADLLNRRPSVAVAAVTTTGPDDDWTDPDWALAVTQDRITRLAAMGCDLRLQHLSTHERAQLVQIAELALHPGSTDAPDGVAAATAHTVDVTGTPDSTAAGPVEEADVDFAADRAALANIQTSSGPDIAPTHGAVDSPAAHEEPSGPGTPLGAAPDAYRTRPAADSPTRPSRDPDLAAPASDPSSSTAAPAAPIPAAAAPTGTARRQPRRRSLDATLDALADAPHVTLLGDLDVVGATGTLEQGDGTFLLLLATWIALHPGTSSTQVTDALWPRVVVDKTVARNTATSKLRRWFGTTPDGQPWLPRVTATAGYRFTDGVTTDWAQFQALSARGISGHDDDALIRALSLVRGRPLGNISHTNHLWVDDLQLEVTAAVVDTAHTLAERSLAAGNPGVALHAVEQGMAADPTAEILWQDLIRARAVARDPAGLRRAIDRAQLVLHQDLSPETIALMNEVTDLDRQATAS